MKAKILMALLLMSFTVVTVAQPSDLIAKKQGMDMKMTRMNEMKRAGNGLNLTEEQKEAFKQSSVALHKQLQPFRNELGEAEAHQRTLATSDKPDFTALNKNIEKIGGIKIEMAKIQTKHRIEMRSQLTDEQKMKFDLFSARKKKGNGPGGMRQQRF